MDNKTTNKDEAKGSETLNHELMIKHVIALFRDTMPFNQLLGLEFVTEGEGLDTQISLHLDWQPELLWHSRMRQVLLIQRSRVQIPQR